MERLSRYPVALATLFVGGVLTAGLWFAARQPYYKPEQSDGSAILNDSKPPVRGWAWADGVPGYRLGEGEDAWNASRVLPRELGPIRRAASSAGVDPETIRFLKAARTHLNGLPHVLVAGENAAGKTCVGAQSHSGDARFLCPPELDHAVAVIVAEARPPLAGRRDIFVLGIARAEIARVAITSPGATVTAYDGATAVEIPAPATTSYQREVPSPWWGAFESWGGSHERWHARLDFRDPRGRNYLPEIRFDSAGDRVAVVG